MVGDSVKQTTPLRLITNQSKIRIQVKKKYSGEDRCNNGL